MKRLRMDNGTVTDGDGRPDTCPCCGKGYDEVRLPEDDGRVVEYDGMCHAGVGTDYPGWQFYHGVGE